MLQKIISIATLSLIALLLLLHIACEKEPQCLNGECSSPMFQCFDNQCGCGPGKVQIGTSLCGDPAYYNYLATSTAGNCLPKNFLIKISRNPDSLISSNPNQPIYGDIGQAWESNPNIAYGGYKKYDVNPNGLVGDKFVFIPDYRCNPSGIAGGGVCSFVIEGEWTHRDTIAGVIRLLGCSPSNDIPELENKYRVVFVKVK